MNPNPEPVDIHVGARIRRRRIALGLSQERLAEALGLTFQQVQKYERAANRVSASKLHALAVFLDTPVEWFFEGLETGPAARGAASSEAETLLQRLMRMTGWRAWVDVLPRLPVAQRARLLDLARAMAGDEDDTAAPPITTEPRGGGEPLPASTH